LPNVRIRVQRCDAGEEIVAHYIASVLHLALSLIVFFMVHSLLADTRVKQRAAERLGLVRWYRLFYTAQSLLLFGWVCLAYWGSEARIIHRFPGMVAQGLGWALVLVGALLAVAAVLRFGGAGFVGLVPERSTGLVRSGLHGHVRHPIYSGIILAALGWLLLSFTLSTVLVVGITFLYLPIGIHLEERKLIALFGKEYRKYRQEVSALIPRFRTPRA
jgi:protein-S-isoprenylcysteine O-methyltransferase Ste14